MGFFLKIINIVQSGVGMDSNLFVPRLNSDKSSKDENEFGNCVNELLKRS